MADGKMHFKYDLVSWPANIADLHNLQEEKGSDASMQWPERGNGMHRFMFLPNKESTVPSEPTCGTIF